MLFAGRRGRLSAPRRLPRRRRFRAHPYRYPHAIARRLASTINARLADREEDDGTADLRPLAEGAAVGPFASLSSPERRLSNSAKSSAFGTAAPPAAMW